jgi:hypothetical protein
MNASPDKPPFRRGLRDSGPFFDHVREATREYARREHARLARLALSGLALAESRQSAEQRWEGEGGSTG